MPHPGDLNNHVLNVPGDGMAFSGDGFDSRILRTAVIHGCNRVVSFKTHVVRMERYEKLTM
jgi:hypothetical protein